VTVIDQPNALGARSQARMFVALRSKGVIIPSARGTRFTDALTIPQLMLMERLHSTDESDQASIDAVSAITGADISSLHEFRSVLDGLGLLDPGPKGITTQVPTGSDALVDEFTAPIPAEIVADVPVLFQVVRGGFEAVDHEGKVAIRLSAVELIAATAFVRPTSFEAARDRQRQLLGGLALDDAALESLVRRGLAADLLLDASSDTGKERASGKSQRMIQRLIRRQMRLRENVARRAAEHDAEVAGLGLTRIVPIDDLSAEPSLALGMLLAHAAAHGGAEVEKTFDLYPNWGFSDERIKELSDRPALILCSNYVWNHDRNLRATAIAKEANPHSIVIHGGPDTPKYEGDEKRYFEHHPYVDITVRGEGEVTFTEILKALAGSFGGDGPIDLSPLRDVPGLAFRLGDEVIRTGERDRITDIDTVPSPYLTGIFDSQGEVGITHVTIETNRGCPYGCTYCDWGSATTSRIRKFDLERVFAELEWCAQHQAESIWVADANFGIFERDVEIARKVAELKKKYGYPSVFTTNYAKNTVKHLQHIVEIMAEAGILTNGLLSLQSMDTDTLLTIRRSNIKPEKYEDLAREFRKAELPLFVDIMLGLPGSTTTSFENDLQECINREVYAKIFPTELLVNSPMNEPSYRAEHKIETQAPSEIESGEKHGTRGFTDRPLVVSTSTFTREDFDYMMQMRRIYFMCENFGVLRQVSRHVRQATGMREIDIYRKMLADAKAEPLRWPFLSLVMRVLPDLMIPPVSWQCFFDELHEYLVEAFGVADDGALRTVLKVQHALLPSRERQFPCTVSLEHDYAAWHRQMVAAKDGGHRDDWHDVVPPLSSFQPATFVVDDPYEVCERARGFRVDLEYDADWELSSPVSRAMPHRHTAL
jgi:radical SAM superfamily enzyme YgiQ (UPF0313 family)